MAFTFNIPTKRLDPKALTSFDPIKFLEAEALNVRNRIVKDSVAGKTAEGGPLKPYSNSYKDAIDSGGIAGKAPGDHRVNLTQTGTLLRSIQTRVNGQFVEIFFEGSHPPARRVSRKGAKDKREKVQKLRSALALGRLGGHVNNALSATQRAERAHKAKSARKASKLNAAFGTGSRRTTRTDRGLGARGDVTNALIAQAQYSMGRTGWFEISAKDKEGITARLSKRISEALKKNLVAHTRR